MPPGLAHQEEKVALEDAAGLPPKRAEAGVYPRSIPHPGACLIHAATRRLLAHFTAAPSSLETHPGAGCMPGGMGGGKTS